MINFLTEENAATAKEKLENSLKLDPTDEDYETKKNYVHGKINWVENKTWPDCRHEIVNYIQKEEIELDQVFIATDNKSIIGKPQLLHPTLQKITLFREYIKINNNQLDEFSSARYTYSFIDDTSDKRSVGKLRRDLSLDFWVYRVIFERKEYYVLSECELPISECELRGMTINVNDTSEFSKSMKLGIYTRLFFVKDIKPTVKLLNKEELENVVKDIDEEKWFNFLNLHPLGTTNNFPRESNLIKTIQLLSGKVDGYPLHLAVIGPAGTRKSMGYIETIAHKFGDDSEIIEGANTRIKALSPSFKEKPANIGYLARCERMGWIDELGKMVEFETFKHQMAIGNVLGELNFLLDHKKRTVGSGNDNDCVVQANSKFLFVMNPVRGKSKIYEHVGIIDATTMSRVIWWVQNDEEQQLVLSDKGISRIPPSPQGIYNNNNTHIVVGEGGEWEVLKRPDFLSIFDTCNSFVCFIDDLRVNLISREIAKVSKEPMTSIWKSRGDHHTKLIIDGICKHRCLFIDKDFDFNIKEEDYENARKLLIRMVNNWDTDLSINKFKDYSGGKL